jgi:HEAT repeat protein
MTSQLLRPMALCSLLAACSLHATAHAQAPSKAAPDKAADKTAPAKAAPAKTTADKAKPAAAKPAAKADKTAAAKPAGKKKAAPNAQSKAAIANAQQMMASDKREVIEAGIQSLGLLGTQDAVEPLAQRIREGLPPELLDQAITTLMALGQPNAGPVLYELAAHRRPEVRLRAVEAIVATKPAGAEQALTAALSDSDAKVRSAAATGLGEVGTSASLEKLFLALDRGNFEASGAIGKVVQPGDVLRLIGYLGRLPFRSLGPAIAQVLQRGDVPENAKLDIIARLEEVGTPEVKGYLNDLVASSGESLPPNVSRAVLRAMTEIAN